MRSASEAHGHGAACLRALRATGSARSRLRHALPLAIVIAVAATTPSLADGPEITRLDFTFLVDEVDPADCFEGTMHVTGSEHVVGQIVDLGDNHFQFHATVTDAIDVAFSNGWTGAWTTDEHFAFLARGDDGGYTNVHRDATAVYDSSGQLVGHVSFRVVEHLTIAGGIPRVDFAYSTLTCDL
jgi:hypothetical protein